MEKGLSPKKKLAFILSGVGLGRMPTKSECLFLFDQIREKDAKIAELLDRNVALNVMIDAMEAINTINEKDEDDGHE